MRARRDLLIAASLIAGAALVVIAATVGLGDSGEPARCADGLVELGARCCGEGQRLEEGRCAGAPRRCAAEMDATPEGCAPREPAATVVIPGGRLRLGPGDWEAQGVVTPREADVPSFRMDVFEVTEARWSACARAGACRPIELTGEPGRPVTGVTLAEAEAYCAYAGGRLPTRDEHAFAMAGEGGRRYPWGDTGAVCRRAAWGLSAGPCATEGRGPDIAGAHPDGRSKEGIYDLSGNVAEWATGPGADGTAFALGGSWADAEAAALRSWYPRAVLKDRRDATIGLRCVHGP